MAGSIEQNFGSLSIPLDGLRAHADLNNGAVVVPETLENHEEIKNDLEAALAAGRRDDPNTLTGYDVAAEVHDENSFYHGRSAYRIFTRAAAFESILADSGGLFPQCPNQEILGLAAPVKPLRDYFYQTGPEGFTQLFSETVVDRTFYIDQVSAGIEAARRDFNLDVLTGREVWQTAGLSCTDTDSLDLFWQTAFTSAWVAGAPTIPVARGGDLVFAPPSPEPPTERSSSAPGGVPIPAQPTPQELFGMGPDGWEVTKDLAGGTVDVGLAGGGLYFQRGVVTEYKMTFRPAPVEGGSELVLQEVDRIPRSGAQHPEPISVGNFKSEEKRMFAKGRKEAELLWERDKVKGQIPKEIVRTGVKRGWVKGAVSPRRVFGWVGMISGLADLATRIFRDDNRGLDGPLTDAGMSPLGARLALVGAGLVGTAAVVLTGGMALPVLAAMGAASAAGLAWETHAAFEEADQELDRKFKEWDAPETTLISPLVG